MARTTAGLLGIIVLGAGLLGLFTGEGRIGQLTNIDLPFDLARIVFGATLLYFGFVKDSENAARGILGTIGAIYIVMGVLGFVDQTMFGLIPNGFTPTDNLFHIVSGVLGGLVALAADSKQRARAGLGGA